MSTPIKIYVENLPRDMDEAAITKYFTRYGEILNTFLLVDKISGDSKGTAFITFQKKSAGTDAIYDLNGANFEGNRLVVKEAIHQTTSIKDPSRKQQKKALFEITTEIPHTPELQQYSNMLDSLKNTILEATNATEAK